MDDVWVEDIVNKHHGSPGDMMAILSEVQSKFGYLPQEALRRVAAATGDSLTDVYAVATFYKAFSLEPRGEHLVSICLGTACHVRGAPRIAEEFSRKLGIQPGETTPDKQFSLETVNCLGACALGPTVVVDNRYFRHLTTTKVPDILNQAQHGFQQADQAADERLFPISVSCPWCGCSLMDHDHTMNGHSSIKLVASHAGETYSLHLAALYGSIDVDGCSKVPDGALSVLSCPCCTQELRGVSACSVCGAGMAMTAVGKYASLHVCPRRGCPGRRLDLLPAVPDASSRKEMPNDKSEVNR